MSLSVKHDLNHKILNQREKPHLRNGDLKHAVAHSEGGCVHRGDDEHGNVWMTRQGVFGKVEGDMDPAAIKQSDGLEMT